MADTSTVLVATSNLVNGVGLAPNTATTTLCSTINSSALVTAYANVQPNTTNGNILAANGLSVTTLGLPLFVSNANTVTANITSQSSKLFPDLPTFTSILLSLSSYVLNASKTYKSITGFSDTTFDSLGINVDSHQSAVTNGIATLFGGGATEPDAIKKNINTLANAIGNLGSAYNVKDLSNLGKPASFIKNLIALGFSSTNYSTDTGFITVAGFLLPTNWETQDDEELTQFLSLITGPALDKIITQTEIVLPYPDSILSAAQLLDLEMVFPAEAVELVPDKNFAGLANMFVNLGGDFDSFADIALMLQQIEIPKLTYLSTYNAPISTADINTLTSKIGYGVGADGNPTIMDVLGSVAGVNYQDLTTVSSALTSVASLSNTTALISSLTNLASACAGGVPSTITSSFASAQTAATTFNNDPVVKNLTTATTAVSNMEAQVATEINNLALSGINLAAAASAGVAGILAVANNLHDYGVDTDGLGYKQLFTGLAQNNAGGDSIIAALSEGKNLSIQAKYGVQIGTKLS